MKVGLVTFVSIVGIAGLIFLLWPYIDILVVVAAIGLFCVLGYLEGRQRRP